MRSEDFDVEWEDLVDRAGGDLWVRPGWVRAWHDSFGTGALKFVTTRRSGALAGVLALQQRGRLLTSPTNWHTPEFDAVAVDDVAARDLFDRVLAMAPASVELRFVDGSGWSTAALATAAEAARYSTLKRTLERSPYLRLDRTWDEYVADRSTRLHRDLRRRQRRLEKRGDVTLDIQQGDARLDALLAEGLALEAAGWKGRQGTAILSQPETRRFYERIAQWAAARGALRLVFLRVGGQALAFELNIEDGRRHFNLKRGYDETERTAAPGKLITWYLLQRLHASGLESYELLGTDEPFKLELTDDVRTRLAVQAFAPTPRGRLTGAAHRYAFPLARRARARAARISGSR